jgi:hypothetical protein
VELFSSVNSLHADVDYSKAYVLGDVHEADEDHDGKLIMRIRRQLPKGINPVSLCCVRPRQKDMSLGQALNLAMEYGPRPATHHEAGASLRAAVPEQIQALFDQADRATFEQGIMQMPMDLSVICPATAVSGKTAELITVWQVVRGCGRPCRVHLRKIDFDAPLFPAQSIAVLSA